MNVHIKTSKKVDFEHAKTELFIVLGVSRPFVEPILEVIQDEDGAIH